MSKQKKILVQLSYGTYLEVTAEILPAIMSGNIYEQKGSRAYQLSDKTLDVVFASGEEFEPEAVENHFKEESEKYSKYWTDERKKSEKLEAELKELKEKAVQAGLTPKIKEEI